MAGFTMIKMSQNKLFDLIINRINFIMIKMS